MAGDKVPYSNAEKILAGALLAALSLIILNSFMMRRYISPPPAVQEITFNIRTVSETRTADAPGVSGLININTADEAMLRSLPGIGEVKAGAIVEYRRENGGFRSVEDVKKVPGIGDKTFENIKDYITV